MHGRGRLQMTREFGVRRQQCGALAQRLARAEEVAAPQVRVGERLPAEAFGGYECDHLPGQRFGLVVQAAGRQRLDGRDEFAGQCGKLRGVWFVGRRGLLMIHSLLQVGIGTHDFLGAPRNGPRMSLPIRLLGDSGSNDGISRHFAG